MNEFNLLIADWLKGKSIYPTIRRILNFLFCFSISSYIFERLYFKYEWLYITDYKEILNFFIKGKFFIPLSIFIIVAGLTEILSFSFFHLINHFKSLKTTRKIIEYEFNKTQIDERIDEFEQISKVVTPIKITKEMLLGLYAELRIHIKPEMFEQIEKELKEPQENIYNNFNLSFRALLAILVYFITLPYFSVYLFVGVLITLIIFMYLLMISYRFLDILPTLARKLYNETENYFKTYMNKKHPVQNI